MTVAADLRWHEAEVRRRKRENRALGAGLVVAAALLVAGYLWLPPLVAVGTALAVVNAGAGVRCLAGNRQRTLEHAPDCPFLVHRIGPLA